MDYVIGCDVGSQGTKAILLSTAGQFAGEAYEGYSIDYPHPLWAEQPVERWLDALTLAIRRLLSESGVSPENVRALSLATQVDGVVSIDSHGQPLHPAIIWMDRRAGAQCERVRGHLGEEQIFQLTGLNLDATHVAPKIRWLADLHPAIYQQADYFLLPGSYMAYALTGELGVDYSNASSTLLMDVHTKTWTETMLAAFEIDKSRLAAISAATATLGTLRPALAEWLGLSTNTLVMVGCGDEHAACLGAGVTRPGIVGDIAGTAEPVCAAAAEVAFDATRLVETHCHADPDLWLLENPGFVSGGNFRWLRDEFARGETYAALDAEAARVPPGAEGLTFLPSLMGAMAPTWNEAARGTYAGFTLAHTRGHFVRALLEGSAYAVRDITTQMQSAGIELSELRVVGGGAKSRLWNQIKADVTGLQVNVPEITETTALGAAFLALVGIGAYATLSEASEHIVKLRECIDPDPQTQPAYTESYGRYRQTYFALLPLFEAAARRTT
ncbi:MAG TPA: FGGY family carbohydrate kinase [Anaerolineales bacterium]|nr:FGGY family carbohydrate kinase [Anaerolineales bacterium]